MDIRTGCACRKRFGFCRGGVVYNVPRGTFWLFSRARARLAIMFPTALPHFACFSDRAEGQVDHRRKKYFLNKKD